MSRKAVVLVQVLVALLVAATGCVAPTPQIVVQTKEVVKVETREVVRVETKLVEKVVTPTREPLPDVTLRAAHYAQWESFNPLSGMGGNWVDTSQRIFSPLVALDLNYKLFGDLAESWSTGASGTSYTFSLRKNVVWHDGEPFSAEDVVFTFELAANPATGSVHVSALEPIEGTKAYSDGEADHIAGIKAIDDYTVQIELSEPNAHFLLSLTKVFMVPKHLLEETEPEDLAASDFMLNAPVGTGPYKLVGFDSVNQVVDYDAHREYHWGAPKTPHVQWVWIPKPESVIIAFEKGEIDYAPWPVWNEGHYKQALPIPHLNLIQRPWAYVEGLVINASKPYFADKRVRQAMFHALDRRQFLSPTGYDKLYNGYFDLAAWAKNPDVDFSQRYPYDPDKARELLDQAGWDPEREVVLYTTMTGADPTRLAIQQMLGEVGIKVKLEQVEVAVVDKTMHEDRPPTYDLYMTGMGLDDPGLSVAQSLTCDSPNNFFGYCDPALDELVAQDRVATDTEIRAGILRQVEALMLEDPVLIPLTFSPQYVGFLKEWHVPRYSWYTFPYMHEWEYRP